MPEGERVRLQFISFDLVPDACGDFVQVYDGSNAGSSLLGKQHVSSIQWGMQEKKEKCAFKTEMHLLLMYEITCGFKVKHASAQITTKLDEWLQDEETF